jgi:hypothetical protein
MSGHRYLTQAQIDRLRRLCEQYPKHVACELVGVTPNTPSRLAKRGWKARYDNPELRPVPTDYVHFCNDLNVAELCKKYRASVHTVKRWNAAVGRKYIARKGPQHHRKVMPANFPELRAKLGQKAAAAVCGVCEVTAKKWSRELGLSKRRKTAANDNRIGWVERYIAERRA